MRIFYGAFFLAFLLAFTAPTLAGTVTYTDGRGIWKSTKCQPPAGMPGDASHNPEARAADLNKRLDENNAFAKEAQGYMDCISEEAQYDANASAQIITRSAEGVLQNVQNAVSTSAGEVGSKGAAAVGTTSSLRAPAMKTTPSTAAASPSAPSSLGQLTIPAPDSKTK